MLYEVITVEKVSGGSSESASTARKDFDDKLNKSKSELIGACMTTLNRNSNDKYGYPVFTLNVSAFTIKPKKFNYDEFNKAFDVLKAAVSKSNRITSYNVCYTKLLRLVPLPVQPLG